MSSTQLKSVLQGSGFGIFSNSYFGDLRLIWKEKDERE